MATKTAGAPAKNGQSSIFDKEIKDEALEKLCADFMETRDPRSKTQRRTNKTAKDGINAAIASMKDVKDGEVVRVGDFLIPVTNRAGGGFEVKTWSKKMAKGVRSAS